MDSHLDHVTCTLHAIGRLLKGSDDVIMTLVYQRSHTIMALTLSELYAGAHLKDKVYVLCLSFL